MAVALAGSGKGGAHPSGMVTRELRVSSEGGRSWRNQGCAIICSTDARFAWSPTYTHTPITSDCQRVTSQIQIAAAPTIQSQNATTLSNLLKCKFEDNLDW